MPRIGAAAAWRDAARDLLARGVPPEDVRWGGEDAPRDLFDGAAPIRRAETVRVPRRFVALADSVVWHRDPSRFARLYAFLWRLKDQPRLIADRADPALSRLRLMEKNVHRCQHKMKAFVRFREIGERDAPRRSFAAWFEPTHHTVEPTASFFARRFGDMDWRIHTPEISAIFENGKVRFIEGLPRPDLPEDAGEALWTTYFRNIFNPARLKVRAMQSEMPKKYWKNMPETAAIPELIAKAPARALKMAEAAPTLPPLRAEKVLTRRRRADAAPYAEDDLRAAIAACTRCPLHHAATQAVPGEGPWGAEIMIVGEQPGDREDLAGRPFVGPAGQVFDAAARAAGLDRSRAFVTNAVKHFKHAPRGKRRLHQRPNASEVSHCRWWLEAEMRRVAPKLIVAMGSTAALSLTGRSGGVARRRGRVERSKEGTPVLITYHPSFALRSASVEDRAHVEAAIASDLESALDWVRKAGAAA